MTRRKKKPIPKLRREKYNLFNVKKNKFETFFISQHWVLTKKGYFTRRFIRAENLKKKYVKLKIKHGRANVYQKIEIVHEPPIPPKETFFRSMCTATNSKILDRKDYRVYVHENEQGVHDAGELQSDLHEFGEAVDGLGGAKVDKYGNIATGNVVHLYNISELRTEIDAIVLFDDALDPNGQEARVGVLYGEFNITSKNGRVYHYKGEKKQSGRWKIWRAE